MHDVLSRFEVLFNVIITYGHALFTLLHSRSSSGLQALAILLSMGDVSFVALTKS